MAKVHLIILLCLLVGSDTKEVSQENFLVEDNKNIDEITGDEERGKSDSVGKIDFSKLRVVFQIRNFPLKVVASQSEL